MPSASLRLIGCESLGVRGLSAFFKGRGASALLDPGVALGFTRHGLHPHPVQAVAGDLVRREIMALWLKASDIILSHLHGDHIPLPNANPFQLSLNLVLEALPKLKPPVVWVPHHTLLRGRELARLKAIKDVLGALVREVRGGGEGEGWLTFYGPVPHGGGGTPVILTVMESGDARVMHAPGTQLLSNRATDAILGVRPDVLIIDGPPIYRLLHDGVRLHEILKHAERVVLRIAEVVPTVIIDHHILRCVEGFEWVERVSNLARRLKGCEVMTAARFSGVAETPFEAWRPALYRAAPVSNSWFASRDGYKAGLKRFLRAYLEVREALKGVNRAFAREDIVVRVVRNVFRSG